SFTVEKTTFVADIRQSITKVTKGISDYVKEKAGTAEDEDTRIFLEIEGKKYDRELIEIAQELTEKEEEIKLEGSKKLFLKIKDYDDYTDIEKRTVSYIRKKFKFTSEANQWLRTEIKRWSATRKRHKETKDPTSSEFKKKTVVSAVFTNLKDAYNWDNLNNLGEKPKTPSQWAGVLLSIVFVLGILSGVAYGLKWSNQETQWDNEGLSAVHGTVIDEYGNSLEGVKVEVGDKKTDTNKQGKYYLYDLTGDEARLNFVMEGYGTVVVWMNIRADGTNIMEIEMNEGEEQTNYDYRKNVAKPWPPNYTLAPIFMIASIVALIGSSAALLHQNFKIAILGCLFGVLSYGFLIGSVLSVVALSLLLVDRERFETEE
ncbi:MAG TPA: carboxypeptidase regulatory-like domain-containing protein, partial [Candidatus Poseidoniales archaeon]|nr:carboxypeptidase regulatory-like domain-containing protein [Candidatus Poseidoniales archaeon]